MRNLIKLSVALCVLAQPIQAHQMFREDADNITTYMNREEFALKNNYEFPAEYRVEVFDKDMGEIDAAEWRSNLRGHTIKILPQAVKDISVSFKPSKEERKYYVCTRLIGGKNVEIELYSRICLRLLIKSTAGADS